MFAGPEEALLHKVVNCCFLSAVQTQLQLIAARLAGEESVAEALHGRPGGCFSQRYKVLEGPPRLLCYSVAGQAELR